MALADALRSASAGERDPQSGDQCPRCHARWRQAENRSPQCRAGGGRSPAGERRCDAWRVCLHLGKRHRRRHAVRGECARLRSVLYNKAARPGHRARPVDGLWFRAAVAGLRTHRLAGRARDQRRDISAAPFRCAGGGECRRQSRRGSPRHERPDGAGGRGRGDRTQACRRGARRSRFACARGAGWSLGIVDPRNGRADRSACQRCRPAGAQRKATGGSGARNTARPKGPFHHGLRRKRDALRLSRAGHGDDHEAVRDRRTGEPGGGNAHSRDGRGREHGRARVRIVLSRPDTRPETIWWKRGIIYQVYPRSFQDSNGDGIGDLEGIRRRLDYLKWLQIDAIWISPIYPSPMADFGYDVADYCGVDPLFGTLADFDRLIEDAHIRDLELILDFVPNHTSARHPWFIESRASRNNPKRDWYIWRDPKADGSPPNNWISNFGGPAWTLDEATGQYYYHAFLSEQPDLIWRNPAVREAMYNALRFWLDRGFDGFRVDVIWHLIKDADFRDNPPNPGWRAGERDISRLLQVNSADQPEIHDVVAEMRRVLDEYDERVLIGEIYLPIERLVTYYGQDLSGAHLPFNFTLIQAAWRADAIAKLVGEYEAALPLGGWPNWVLGNHDQPRIATRIGAAQAGIAAMLLLTLRGTPTMYYGDEIGLQNVPGLGLGRDPYRTPMQWSAARNAGFSDGEPWLPVAADYESRNVEALRDDPCSLLTLYRRLIGLRREHIALSIGDYVAGGIEGDVFWFERRHGETRLIVALNFGHEASAVRLS